MFWQRWLIWARNCDPLNCIPNQVMTEENNQKWCRFLNKTVADQAVFVGPHVEMIKDLE